MPPTDLKTAGIQEILNSLQDEFYEPIGHHLSLLSNADSYGQLQALLREFLLLRNERLIPYLRELSRKAVERHDCASCTGKCHLEHGTYLLQMHTSHDIMRDAIFGESYGVHHKELSNLLATAILIESTYLLPAINEAQKAINAKG